MEQEQPQFYITDNIIVGKGEVPAINTPEGVVWILPGGQRTSSSFEAIAAATEIDHIIKNSAKKLTKRHRRRY
jgi:hypothetical protein